MFAEDVFALDQTVYEDVLADSFTVMEALLLRDTDWKGKGRKLCKRGAALVAPTVADIDHVAGEIEAAYDLRGRIVHGDVRPDAAEVRTSARRVRTSVRQILVTLLRLGGDQGQVIATVGDASVLAAVRKLVPSYPG